MAGSLSPAWTPKDLAPRLAGNSGPRLIVIDMRNNSRGSNELHHTMASYLFTPAAPAAIGWVDWYEYDKATGELEQDVTYFAGDYRLSSPAPELTYTEAVVVLVNENTASAGEYFTQFIKSQGRDAQHHHYRSSV